MADWSDHEPVRDHSQEADRRVEQYLIQVSRAREDLGAEGADHLPDGTQLEWEIDECDFDDGEEPGSTLWRGKVKKLRHAIRVLSRHGMAQSAQSLRRALRLAAGNDLP